MITQQRRAKTASDGAHARGVATFLSIANPAWFLVANAALHLLRRDLSPATHYISEYAVGKFGWLMASALVILGVGTLSLSFCLARITGTDWPARVGVAFLSVSGVSTILIGLFRTDIDGHGPTLAGHIHGRAALIAILLEAISVLFFTARFARDGRWGMFRIVSCVFAAMIVIAGALYSVLPHGTGERLLVYTLVAWLLITGIQARHVACPHPNPSPASGRWELEIDNLPSLACGGGAGGGGFPGRLRRSPIISGTRAGPSP